MDYCSTCCRHLNGALVCPGCGAYAPDIAPPTTYSGAASTWDTTSVMTAGAHGTSLAGQAAAPEAGQDGPLHGDAEIGPGASTAAPADVEGTRSAGLGRAARRRQLARWKKNKRRAAVATAVAFVGGGLTVATLERQPTDRAQAATTSDDRSMQMAQEQVPHRDRPAPAPPVGDRPSRVSAQEQAPGAATARPRPPATPASVVPSNPRSTAAAPPSPPPVTASEPAPPTTLKPSAPTVADTGGTSTQPSAAPATADRPEPGASQADPVPASTSSPKVCLLVLCLG
ncbi:SCO2400 family protein [Streptomyces flaveolus]|uniref:SCO2400 family protein n=1 Tax=Streptomyces flaveolus TaxID=67297 RepID=UPI0036A5AF1C